MADMSSVVGRATTGAGVTVLGGTGPSTGPTESTRRRMSTTSSLELPLTVVLASTQTMLTATGAPPAWAGSNSIRAAASSMASRTSGLTFTSSA